jgi:hypothetical protein
MKLSMVGAKTAGAFTVKIAIVAAATLGGTALISSSVFAALTASANNTAGGSVTSGTLILTQAPSSVSGITGGFATAITGMAPGDVVNRYVNLTNGGTLNSASMTLGATGSGATALTTNGTAGLQVTIKECSIAWTAAGACTGTNTTDLASTSILSLATPASLTLQANSLLSGAVIYLQIGIALPTGNEVTVNGTLPGGTVQGLTTAITWTFTATQRIATTTNS